MLKQQQKTSHLLEAFCILSHKSGKASFQMVLLHFFFKGQWRFIGSSIMGLYVVAAAAGGIIFEEACCSLSQTGRNVFTDDTLHFLQKEQQGFFSSLLMDRVSKQHWKRCSPLSHTGWNASFQIVHWWSGALPASVAPTIQKGRRLGKHVALCFKHPKRFVHTWLKLFSID